MINRLFDFIATSHGWYSPEEVERNNLQRTKWHQRDTEDLYTDLRWHKDQLRRHQATIESQQRLISDLQAKLAKMPTTRHWVDL